MNYPLLQIRTKQAKPLENIFQSFTRFLKILMEHEVATPEGTTECYGFIVGDRAWVIDFCTGQVLEDDSELIDCYSHLDFALKLEPAALSLVLDGGSNAPLSGVTVLMGTDTQRDRFCRVLSRQAVDLSRWRKDRLSASSV